MDVRIDPELAQALHASNDELEIVDPSTDRVYVIVTKERWSNRAAYDDTDVSPNEMLAAAAMANAGPDGWDAPDLSRYDSSEYDASPDAV